MKEKIEMKNLNVIKELSNEEDDSMFEKKDKINYEDFIDSFYDDKNVNANKMDVDDIMMLQSTFYKVPKIPMNEEITLSKIKQTMKFKKTNITFKDIEESFLNEFSGTKKAFVEVHFNSFIMTILQIINCIIKSSLVQMAYCMKTLGLVYGSFSIIIISFLSSLSLKLLMKTHEKTQIKNYLIFSEKLFGKFGKFIILNFNFGSAYGSCLTFIIIFNKVIPNILNISLGKKSITNNNIYLSLILGIILYIYCFKKDISGIKKAAYYAFLGIIFFFILTIIDFFYEIREEDIIINFQKLTLNDILWGMDNNWYTKLTSIACIILSFSFHIFTFSIYGCMGEISIYEFVITSTITIFICAAIYLICGICGFLLYYNNLNDSILDAIGDKFINSLLSMAFGINIIMTFPITFTGLKNYWILLIEVYFTKLRDFFYFCFSCFKCVKKRKKEILFLKKEEANNFFGNKASFILPKSLEYIAVLILFISVFYIATIFSKLKIIFGIVGGIMGNCLTFIFPALFYFFIDNDKWRITKYNLISIFFIIFGFLLLVYLFFFLYYNLIIF